MLRHWTSSGRRERTSEESPLRSGARLISWSCSQHSCLTGTESDSLQLSEEMLRMPLDVHHVRSMFREPHVLSAACFNFGDNTSFILPLPIAMPLIFHHPAVNEEEQQASFDYLPERDLMSRLPLRSREKICKYVGFHSFFNKCPILNSYLNVYSGADYGHDRQVEEKNKYIGIIILLRSYFVLFFWSSNPLLLVSKLWCFTARRALLLEWRRGACVEWRLLADIMADRTVSESKSCH